MRARLGALAFLVLLVAPATVGASEVTTGTASADSILVRLTTALGTISLGTDDAQAVNGTSPRAFARFITGQTDDAQIGASERETTTKGDKATASVGDVDLELGDFITLGTIGADISTEVGDEVTSSVVAEFGGADLMRGLAGLDVGSSTTEATTGDNGSHVSRSIHLAGFHALALRDFLGAIGVSPLDLTCDAVSDLGGLLGVDSANCQSVLDAVNASIADAIEALQAAESDVMAARDDVQAGLDAANAALDSLGSDLDAKQTELSGLGAQIDAATASKSDLQDDVDALETTLADLEASQTTLQAQKAALESQTAGTSRAQLQSDRDTVSSCDALTGLAQVTCQTTMLATDFIAIASTYGVDLTGLGFSAARTSLLGAIAPLLAAWDDLDAVDAQLVTVGGQIDDVNAQIDALTVQIDDLTTQIDDLTTDAAAVQSDIDDLNAQIDAKQAEIDDLTAQLAQLLIDIEVINAADASDSTCVDAASALADVSDRVPSLTGSLDPIASELDVACGGLEDEVKELLGTPLLTVDGIDITIEVSAREGDSSVSVTGSIGSIQIGSLDPIVVDLPAGSNEIPVAQGIIDASFDAIAAATGIGLPAPEFGFLVTEQDAGQAEDGTWYANGSVTFIRLRFPAGAVDVPSQPPLGPLDGSDPTLMADAGGPSLLAAARGGSPARTAVDTPAVTLDLATFEAAGTFLPSSVCVSNCGGGGTGGGGGARGSADHLPGTGVAGFGWFAPALAFGAAGIIRRALRRF